MNRAISNVSREMVLGTENDLSTNNSRFMLCISYFDAETQFSNYIITCHVIMKLRRAVMVFSTTV